LEELPIVAIVLLFHKVFEFQALIDSTSAGVLIKVTIGHGIVLLAP